MSEEEGLCEFCLRSEFLEGQSVCVFSRLSIGRPVSVGAENGKPEVKLD